MAHEAPLVAEREMATIRQTSRLEVAEFMTGLDDDANSSFGDLSESGIKFNGLNSRWEPVNQPTPIDTALIYAPAREAQDALLKALNKYRSKQGQSPLSLELLGAEGAQQSLTSAYSMLDTLAAKDRRAEGASGKLKKVMRFLNDHAGTGKTFVSLLPSDFMGGSIVSGGLGAIFTAMEQTGVHRTEIHRVILRLPDLLEELSSIVEIYEESEDLHRYAAKVYVCLFAVMRYILNWFTEKDIMTGMKSVINPNRNIRKLNDLMADLELGIQSFQKYALMLSQKRQKKLEQIGYHGLYGQSLMLQSQKFMSSTMEEMNQRLQRLEALERMAQVLMPLGTQFLTEGFSETRAIEMAQERSAAPRRKKPTVTPDQVLDAFKYDPSILADDLDALTTLQPARDRLDENRVCALNHNAQVRAWLSANHSSLLLLNGRTDSIPKSEVSFFAANMVKRLRDLMERDEDLVVLGFFCGQHREQDDPYGNPSELLLNLLSQLVDSYDFDSEDLDECRRTNPEDIDSILVALARLIHALDERTILTVVVDGLKFLSEPHTAHCLKQTRRVVRGLVDICREKPRATVKMMFSSPVRCECVEELFYDDEILDMPRSVKPAGGYRESSWQESPLDLDDDDEWL